MLPAELWALKSLEKLKMSRCSCQTALPAGLCAITVLKGLNLSFCDGLTALPAELWSLMALEKLDLSRCAWLTALPAELFVLTVLKRLKLVFCYVLTALSAKLGALIALDNLDLQYCPVLHTPPPAVVRAGTASVKQFLCDLSKGSAMCHFAKVTLLGDQCAGKSSLVDSLVLSRPTTRAADDRTVGIDVCRWWLSGSKGFSKDELVVNIYDNVGQRVYRASQPVFMTDEALFLHVVKTDASEDEVIAAVLEWRQCRRQRPAPLWVSRGRAWTWCLVYSGRKSVHLCRQRALGSRVQSSLQPCKQNLRLPKQNMTPSAFANCMSRQVPAILNQLMEVLLSDAKCVKQCSRGSWRKSSDACGQWMGPCMRPRKCLKLMLIGVKRSSCVTRHTNTEMEALDGEKSRQAAAQIAEWLAAA